MRKFLNKHGSLVAVILLLIAAALWYIFLRGAGGPNVSKAYFVDDETGDEQILSLEQYPPRINPKTGKPTLVQAVKYTCDGGKTIRTAYYLKYSDGLKAELEKLFKQNGKPAGVDVSGGTFVRSPDKNSKWISAGSPDASAVTRMTCPEGGDIELVLPP